LSFAKETLILSDGGLLSANLLNAIDGFVISLALLYLIYKLIKYVFSYQEAIKKSQLELETNKMHYQTYCLAYKIGIIKKAAEVEKIDLVKEMESLPKSNCGDNIAEVVRKQVEKDISR
jgi:hypothetical protein